MVLRFCSTNMLRFEIVYSYTMIFTPSSFKKHGKTTATRKSIVLKNNTNNKKACNKTKQQQKHSIIVSIISPMMCIIFEGMCVYALYR